KPTGAFILFCFVLAIAFFATKRFLPGAKHQASANSIKTITPTTNQVVESFQNTNYSALHNLPPPTSDPPAGGQATNQTRPTELPISLFAETPQAQEK